jgi:hypothetical protein
MFVGELLIAGAAEMIDVLSPAQHAWQTGETDTDEAKESSNEPIDIEVC